MKISVALCTFNGEKFLEEQMDSILGQTEPVDEIVISDDNSSDGTLSIIERYRRRYPALIRYRQNHTTLGSVKNFEEALKACSGDYIFLADQDDIWLPDKVKEVCRLFRANPDAEGIFSDALLIDEVGAPLGGTLWESIGVADQRTLMVQRKDFFKFMLMLGNIAAGATLAIRSNALHHIIPFRLSHNSQHDQSIALILSERNSLITAPVPLIKYRIHDSQQVGTSSKDRWHKNFEIKRDIWQKGFFSVEPHISLDKSWAYYNRASVFCHKPGSIKFAEDAARIFRKSKKAYLSNFSFLRRKRLLHTWYKKSIFSTSLWEVIFSRG